MVEIVHRAQGLCDLFVQAIADFLGTDICGQEYCHFCAGGQFGPTGRVTPAAVGEFAPTGNAGGDKTSGVGDRAAQGALFEELHGDIGWGVTVCLRQVDPGLVLQPADQLGQVAPAGSANAFTCHAQGYRPFKARQNRQSPATFQLKSKQHEIPGD